MNTPLSSQPLCPSQSLWDFALAFYAQSEVAEACLQLQDEHQANVCLLIGLRWLDVHKQHLDDQQLIALNEHIKNWMDEVIVPLRLLRRELKLPFENLAQDEAQEQLRTAIKHAELLAEKKLLVEIERWASQISNSQISNSQISSAQINSAQGADNLERYLVQLGSPIYLHNLLLRK